MKQIGEVSPTVFLVAAEVAAGDEDITGSGNNKCREIVRLRDVVDGVADTEIHRWCHSVSSMGTIDSENSNRTLALELQELRATPVAFRRSIWKSHTFTVLPAAHQRRGEPIVGLKGA